MDIENQREEEKFANRVEDEDKDSFYLEMCGNNHEDKDKDKDKDEDEDEDEDKDSFYLEICGNNHEEKEKEKEKDEDEDKISVFLRYWDMPSKMHEEELGTCRRHPFIRLIEGWLNRCFVVAFLIGMASQYPTLIHLSFEYLICCVIGFILSRLRDCCVEKCGDRADLHLQQYKEPLLISYSSSSIFTSHV